MWCPPPYGQVGHLRNEHQHAPKNKWCEVCGRKKHNTWECNHRAPWAKVRESFYQKPKQSTFKQYKEKIKLVQCHLCLRWGHYRVDCPLEKRDRDYIWEECDLADHEWNVEGMDLGI